MLVNATVRARARRTWRRLAVDGRGGKRASAAPKRKATRAKLRAATAVDAAKMS